MRLLRFDGSSRRYRLIGIPVTWLHEVAFELLFYHLNFSQPFARGGPDPTGHQSAGGKSMMMRKGGTVHMCGYQSSGIRCFFDRNAAKRGTVKRALPNAPRCHLIPGTLGSWNARPFPAHSSVLVMEC